MNVQQAIQKLASYAGDTEILIACDEEGNRFHTLADVDLYFVLSDDIFGNMVDQIYDVPDCDHAENEVCDEFTPRVVLWP